MEEMYTHFKTHLNDPGKIIPISDIDKHITKDTDHYANLFFFGKEVLDYFNKHKSISGYPGEVFTDKLVFDFDSQDLAKAKDDVESLLLTLTLTMKIKEESIGIWFSGGKGFHVEVKTNSRFNPEQLKNVCSALAGQLDSFDTVIYSTVRAFRLPNTKHNVSGLYKIPLPVAQFKDMSISQIKEMATNTSSYSIELVPTNVNFHQFYRDNKTSEPISSEEDENGIRGLDLINFNKCPKHLPRCIFALTNGVMVPGERSQLFFILAKFYRNQAFDKLVTHRILKGVSELNSKLYPQAKKIDKDEIWTQHIASAYSQTSLPHQKPGGTGTNSENELLLKYCKAIKANCKCSLHTNKVGNTTLKIEDVSSIYESYASDLESNRVLTGINFIDHNMQITLGTTNLLVGSTGSGKTSLALNLMQNSTMAKQRALFFSLDMHKTLVYQKLAQKVTDYTGPQIQHFYKTKNKVKIEEVKSAIANNFGLTHFDFTTCLTLEQMKDKIKAVEDETSDPVKLVVVDYASRISGPYSDTYANARYNALQSTGVADETNAAWVFINQISRNAGDSFIPLRTKRVAKESGDWEETATNVITVWRPFAGYDDKDQVMKMFLAKNRMGREVEGALVWNGAKGEVRDMTEEENYIYESEIQPEEATILKARMGKK